MLPRFDVSIIIGIVSLACVSVFGAVAAFKHYEIMDKVNDRLPNGQQFEPSWWYLSKHQQLRREYKRLYPDGRLLLQVHVATGLMFAWLLVSALGFVPPLHLSLLAEMCEHGAERGTGDLNQPFIRPVHFHD
jgi:hypothetical protein